MANLLGVRDVYNLICGKPGTFVVDIRRLEEFKKSHIVGAENFVESDYSSTAPNALLQKITTQLKKQFDQTFNFAIFVADAASLGNFEKIQNAFKGTKFKNIFYLESAYDTFRNKYPFVCHDNFFLKTVSEFPCEILPNLFLGQYPPNYSKDATQKYFTSLGITHVINITADNSYIVPKDITVLQFKLNDEKYEELPLENIVEFIDKSLNSPRPSSASSSSSSSSSSARVLVHCRQGISRSASGVTAYIIYKYRITVRQALTVVKSQRNVIQPIIDFLRQLYCFEAKLGIPDVDNKYGDTQKITGAKGAEPFNIRNFTHIPPAMVNMVGVFHSGSMRVYVSRKK